MVPELVLCLTGCFVSVLANGFTSGLTFLESIMWYFTVYHFCGKHVKSFGLVIFPP